MKYIYGLNKSGKSIIDYLDSIDENYFCWDDNKNKRKEITKGNNNVRFINPKNLDFKLINESYITPGISLNDKKINILKNHNIALYRDLELYSRLTKDKKIIAITGTNGKSTTTKLVSEILKSNKLENFSGGNIGLPLLDFLKNESKKKFHVIELSSFQLESKSSLKPLISILLNISPDHLDRYQDYDEYAKQKEKIINLNDQGFNIVSIDDQKTLDIYRKNRKKIIPLSFNFVEKGIFFKDNKIIDRFFEKNTVIELPIVSNSLIGNFNKQNILASYAVVKILNLDIKKFLNSIKIFKGLPHRLEMIYDSKNIKIINNSKATNVESLIKSVECYNNIHLIVGGRAKEKDFTKILDFKKNIVKIYIFGESSKNIFNQLKKEIYCEIFNNLEESLKNFFKNIKQDINKQNIIFSPGCTSFDQYANFEERGQHFKKLINKFINDK